MLCDDLSSAVSQPLSGLLLGLGLGLGLGLEIVLELELGSLSALVWYVV